MPSPDKTPHQPTWTQRIEELKSFIALHGHGNVTPQTHGHLQLGSWVSSTRNKARYGKLTAEQIVELKNVGFLWEIDEFRKSGVFERWLDELKAFTAKHGHCNVTPKTPGYEQLGSWVSSQRVRHKKGLMYAKHVGALNAVGFLWNLKGQRKSTSFDKWVIELKKYVTEHGNCNVTPKTPGHEQLGAWVSSQRVRRSKGLMDDRHIKSLNELGFVWEFQAIKSQQTWIKKYHELEAYYLEHGHSDMPRTHKQKTLANWVWIQRLRRKGPYLRSEQLTPAQVGLLDKLGFKWDPHEENWMETFQELKAYGEKHSGKFDPIEDEALSRWASSQRRSYHRGELAQERVDQLNTIAFTWESAVSENLWQEYYAELKAYHQTHGDANPSRLRNPQIGAWCVHQRQSRKAGKMPEHQIKLLDELGFVWSPHEKTPWDVHFAALQAFIAANGDSYVPHIYAPNRKLGFFARTLRIQYAAGKLNAEQIAKLEAIGFQWAPSGRIGRRRRS